MNTSVSVRVFISDDGFPLANISVRIEPMNVPIPSLVATKKTNAAGIADFNFPAAVGANLAAMRSISVRVSLVDASNKVVRARSRSVRLGATTVVEFGLTGQFFLGSSLAPTTPDRKQERMVKLCREMTNASSTPLGQESLCLMHAILGSVTRLEAPKTAIEKQVSEFVVKKYGPEASKQARLVAEDILKTIESCNLPPGIAGCADTLDLDAMAHRMFAGNDPIFQGLKELAQRQEPDPATTLGPQGAGWKFLTPFVPSKDCSVQYEIDFPNGTDVLAPPTINLIEAWDPGLESIVREGHVGLRQLVARSLDLAHGWNAKNTDMNIPVVSNDALILVADNHPASTTVTLVAHPVTGNQVLAVDVRPGLKIRLSGVNFIADTCRLTAEFRGLDVPTDRKLVPLASVQPAVGLDSLQLTVHGDNTPPPVGADVTTTARDAIVFEWPATLTTPGLYSLHVSFANTTGIPTTMVHDAACGTTPDFGPARSQVIHFVILPVLSASAATLRLTEAQCVQKSGILYDNVLTKLNGATVRLVVDPSSGDLVETMTDESSGEFSRLVWSTPASWDPALQSYPDTPPRPLRFDETTIAHLIVLDAPHGISSVILAVFLTAIFLVALLIAIGILIIVIALIIAAIASGGTALAVYAAIVAGTFAISGTLLGLLFTGLGHLFNLVVATFNANPIGVLEVSFNGAEFAHLTSEFRFHQAVWTVPRSAHVLAAGGMDNDGGPSITTTRVRERWESQEGGGDYRFTTEAQRT